MGATGVLRPAAHRLLDTGRTVLAVARDPERLSALAQDAGPRLIPVSLDVFDETAVEAAAASPTLRDGVDAAIMYLAATDDTAENRAAAGLSRAVRGRTVRILTSRWTPTQAPDLSHGRWPAAKDRVHLLLGSTGIPGGDGPCWHTPEQISAAALATLHDGTDAMLGYPNFSATPCGGIDEPSQ